ncbi:MAG: hemolysin family protein, partial [Parachlamydiaceae bacterium]
LFLMLIMYYGMTENLAYLFSKTSPKTVWLMSLPSSLFLTLVTPLTYTFFKLSDAFGLSLHKKGASDRIGELKQEIFEIVQDAELSSKISLQDKKMIEAAVRFQNKIAREVMVPRIDMFMLNTSTSVREAAKLLQAEGFSRVPVYKDSIDHIVGLLMFRDLLARYMAFQVDPSNKNILDAPIESLLKPILYAPETKKISNLLQEFKKKQSHLAIVVDEYGGTAGMITIEDILEEIVGDIEDEYDDEEDLYTKLSDGVYLVDGRLTVMDAKDDLGIILPQEGDYDTIGGFIFQRAGAIPEKGFKVQLDECELEVVKSNDRRIEKVKIKKYPHDN